MAAKKKSYTKKKLTKKVTRRKTDKADTIRTPVPIQSIFNQVLTPQVIVREPSNTRLVGVPDIPPSARLAAAKAAADKINRHHKSRVVITADEAHTNAYLRRPCGLMQLDIDTGGGLPAASFSTISGPDNSGKTTLLYMYYAMHQRLYGDAAYNLLVSTEAQIDYWMARRVGWVIPVPWDLIRAEQKERGDRNVPLLTDLEVAELRREIGVNTLIELSVGEDILDALEANLATNVYGIAGIDSLEGLMPKAEAETDSYHDNPQQASRAGILTRFFQHYGPISRDPNHFTSLIATGQVRSNRQKTEAASFMQKYIKDWVDVVPYSVRHYRQINVVVWSGKKLNVNDGKDRKRAEGKNVNWEIKKGKSNTHDNITGEAPYYYDQRCFDTERSVVLAGLRYGVIAEEQGLLTFYTESTPHPVLQRLAGVDRFIETMQQDFELELMVRREILAAAGKPCVYR